MLKMKANKWNNVQALLFKARLRAILFFFFLSIGLQAVTPTVNVRVDSRMEMLFIVWSMTDWPRHFTPYAETSPYAKDVEASFGSFRDHSAIRLFREIAKSDRNWAFDAPPEWILCYGPPPEMELLTPLPEEIIKRLGGVEKGAKLIEAFRKFARDTNFKAFFLAHGDFYKKLETDYQQVGRLETRWKTMTRFFGVAPMEATVILAPLSYFGNYGLQIQMPNGSNHFVLVDSPANYIRGSYVFDSDSIGALIYHEFGHCFVNKTVLAYPGRNARAGWMPLIGEAMRKQGYADWDTVICESVARASEICLAEFGGEPDLANRRRKESIAREWYWVPALAERMMEFPARRDFFPDFATFVPRLLETLDELEPITETTLGEFQGTRPRKH